MHLWSEAILHFQLGPVVDALRRHEKWKDKRIELIPDEEIKAREKSECYAAQEKKEKEELEHLTSDEAKEDLKMSKKELNRLKKMPLPLSPIDQAVLQHLQWSVPVAENQIKDLQVQYANTKQQHRDSKTAYKEIQKNRDITAESALSATNNTLASAGIDRQVYFQDLLIGPHIQKLLEHREDICKCLKQAYLQVRERYYFITFPILLSTLAGLVSSWRIQLNVSMRMMQKLIVFLAVSEAMKIAKQQSRRGWE